MQRATANCNCSIVSICIAHKEGKGGEGATHTSHLAPVGFVSTRVGRFVVAAGNQRRAVQLFVVAAKW